MTKPLPPKPQLNHPADTIKSEGLFVENLGKAYGRETVLRDVSFSLLPGKALGISGSNGAGKTTLIHLLSSILTPNSGLITLFGIPSDAAAPTGTTSALSRRRSPCRSA